MLNQNYSIHMRNHGRHPPWTRTTEPGSMNYDLWARELEPGLMDQGYCLNGPLPQGLDYWTRVTEPGSLDYDYWTGPLDYDH